MREEYRQTDRNQKCVLISEKGNKQIKIMLGARNEKQLELTWHPFL